MERAHSRRRFLEDLGRIGFATWVGAELLLDAAPHARASDAPAATARGILRVRMQAARLDATATFYREAMGWPVTRHDGRLEVQAGGTTLELDAAPAGEAPYYHVAWAIPTNKFEQAKAWLAERTAILRHPDGRDEFHFSQVNRRAFYFADPAGNILELIARDDLGDTRPGPFTLSDVLYVNHVGLVVDDVLVAVERLRADTGLALRREPIPTFAQLGDAHRHLVLVNTGRVWLPEMNRGARVYPVDVALHGGRRQTFEFEPYPYRIDFGS